MTAMKLHRYPSPSGGVALGKIGARRTARILPYDAEVEYLESTGTQWIDTGVFHNYDNAVRFKLRMPTFDKYSGPYSDYVNENTRCTRVIYGTKNDFRMIVYNGSIAGTQGIVFQFNTIQLEGYTSKTEYKINGISSAANPGTPGVATRSMKLFYSNANGPSFAKGTRFWYFKIDNQIDLIPVRCTNEQGVSEGAMYDRANPTVGMNLDGSARDDGLYRNRGTGAFPYGNDI